MFVINQLTESVIKEKRKLGSFGRYTLKVYFMERSGEKKCLHWLEYVMASNRWVFAMWAGSGCEFILENYPVVRLRKDFPIIRVLCWVNVKPKPPTSVM